MRVSRSTFLPLAAAFLSALGLVVQLGAASLLGSLELQTADGQRIDPLAVGTNKAVVVLFISTDCPICNGYQPEIERLRARYAPLGIDFVGVYSSYKLEAWCSAGLAAGQPGGNGSVIIVR